MNRIIEIKGIKLGEGIPKICTPLISDTDEKLLEEAKEVSIVKEVDLVEWRVDYYKYAKDIDKVKNILKEIILILKDKPLLFTFRTKKEGGEKEITEDEYIYLNTEIIKTKMIDLVDVELSLGDENSKVILEEANKFNVTVIMSNHDFNKTPEKKEIINRLEKMILLGADIAKIALMPKNEEDVLTLLSATNEVKKLHEGYPIIAMSMGGTGLISRISGEVFGSILTFGSIKNASAPGQIPVKELEEALKIIHKYK
ncbi:type I 3-dehydroquinate dehydratase [uncultured Clostridium sp.]|uniref:type I 3-dehydroquinate dehydratase n=1 Tax=uncultured Clostridium sp. TaxID=59620 RepID=UPI0025FBAE4E|nr:type I 3-dehydroquinate dehydratase [uncultured Clostridium sp.]